MTALLLVDIQNDFLPGGALEVQNGDHILPVVNHLLQKKFNLIVASKDWHPPAHSSFAATHHRQPGDIIVLNNLQQILWPVHCVQGTPGAEFSSKLNAEKIDNIFYKGTNKEIDSYSAFFDNQHDNSTGLVDFLKQNNIHDIYVTGLATDYCVKYTVLDAIREGFNVFVIAEGCKGVNLHPDDTEKALNEMQQAGAKIVSLKDLSDKITGSPRPAS